MTCHQGLGFHVCSFESTDDLRGKRLTYENVKARVLQAGRFSVFEATADAKRARLFDRLMRDPEIETDITCGFPWTKVRPTGGAPMTRADTLRAARALLDGMAGTTDSTRKEP